MIEVASRHRHVRLHTPPPDGSQRQYLLVPTGSHDTQVLAWAREVLAPDAAAELAAALGLDGDETEAGAC